MDFTRNTNIGMINSASVLIHNNNFDASFVRASKVQRSSTFHKRYNIHLRLIFSSALNIKLH